VRWNSHFPKLTCLSSLLRIIPMALVIVLPLCVIAAYFLWFPYTLVLNVFRSKETGFPTIWTLTDPNHIVWMLSMTPLRKWFQRWLPDIIYRRLVLSIYGWEFHERTRPYKVFAAPQGNAKSFILVTCRQNELWTWDAEIVSQILSRPRDFVQQDLANILVGRLSQCQQVSWLTYSAQQIRRERIDDRRRCLG
jgi:hypothetical protein